MLVWRLHRPIRLFWLRGDAYSAVPKQYMSKNTALAPFFWADSMVVEGNAQREKGRQQATQDGVAGTRKLDVP